MSPIDKILEAIRLGLSHLSGEDRAAHLRMHLREVGIEAGHPALIGGAHMVPNDQSETEEIAEIEPTLSCSRSPLVSFRLSDGFTRAGVEVSPEGARHLAAHLLLAAFDAEELAGLPRRPVAPPTHAPRRPWPYHPPEINSETDRGDLEPEEEP